LELVVIEAQALALNRGVEIRQFALQLARRLRVPEGRRPLQRALHFLAPRRHLADGEVAEKGGFPFAALLQNAAAFGFSGARARVAFIGGALGGLRQVALARALRAELVRLKR